MMQFQFFPRSVGLTEPIAAVVECFQRAEKDIGSASHKLSSDGVLKVVRPHLLKAGYRVEAGKHSDQKIKVPVLFGLNNTIDKFFDADAISPDGKVVVEIEAGRALDNYQFLKNIFQASLMCGVEYLVIAVRNRYRSQNTFDRIAMFSETLYVSNRIRLPLHGILLIGYEQPFAMKSRIIVWTLAWDTRTGTDCRVFGSEHELDEHIREIVSDDLSAIVSPEADGIRQLLDVGEIWDAFEAWRETYKDPLDTYNWDSQELDVELEPALVAC